MNPTPVLSADADAIRNAAELLRSGRLVAFPTETVYGLGANALDPDAVARIFIAKGRPATNPLIVHVADVAQVLTVAAVWSDSARRLAEAFWPGPLTIVVPKAADIPEVVTGGGATVAVRCPAHSVTAQLLREAAIPLAAPSANRSGDLSPTTAEHVATGLSGRIDLILDGGPCPGGLESTVVDATGPVVRLLRPGLISVAQLEVIVGPVTTATVSSANTPLPSPGMLTRHYAPRTKLECAESTTEADFLASVYETAGLKVARWDPTGSSAGVAARLYAELHALDAAGYDRILVALPPDADEWRAVRDRLTRAAAE